MWTRPSATSPAFPLAGREEKNRSPYLAQLCGGTFFPSNLLVVVGYATASGLT
jgi:hypothetical protein